MVLFQCLHPELTRKLCVYLSYVAEGGRRKSKRLAGVGTPSGGGFLVLQLHDELMYEVSVSDVQQVALIVKNSMEGAMSLSVKMPVKIKTGPSWGALQDYDV